ncbi:hypothetical protein [Ciceribacter sp. RN22]|uniref:hypothetical protein n=1 Tax=Ciceribacter sp. RN22 TaxID=2954932 RepID=UPI002093202F|nr:hypothetical protein [Ciceribacter sp. RN22]MCO6180328.1 hypothetical protein [Ciceribacter sp. RN22]
MMFKRVGAVIAATAAFAVFATGELQARHRHEPNPGVVAGSGLPSVLPGIGTYAGSISALRIRGTGIYFMVEHSTYKPALARPAPRARIIDVNAEVNADKADMKSACRYEAGVCVIRP